MAELAVGPLYRIVGALDSLFTAISGLTGAMEPEERVTVFGRTRVLGILALRYLTDEQRIMLEQILHPDFFESPRDTPLPSDSAKASLAVLHGFIHGCIAEAEIGAQMEANARAYAEAKIKEEHGIGFRGMLSD